MVRTLGRELERRHVDRQHCGSRRAGMVRSERAAQEFPCTNRRKIPATRRHPDRNEERALWIRYLSAGNQFIETVWTCLRMSFSAVTTSSIVQHSRTAIEPLLS